MAFDIIKVATGKWRQLCYIVYNAEREALIFDPGSDADNLIEQIEAHELKPLAILNTHAHYDHIGAVMAIMNHYDIPFYLHSADKKLLMRANLYASIFESKDKLDIPESFLALDQQTDSANQGTLTIGTFSVDFIHVPGHTAGSVCFLIDDCCISGDTLLHGAIGRVDLPGGNRDQLSDSLKQLSHLDTSTIIYPGHGQQSTIGEELLHNRPFQESIYECST